MLRAWRKVRAVWAHLSCTDHRKLVIYTRWTFVRLWENILMQPLSYFPSAFFCPSVEELQKVLLEQIDFRRRLEQEFHALKGTSPFPVFRKSVFSPLPWFLFSFHTLKGNFSFSVFLIVSYTFTFIPIFTFQFFIFADFFLLNPFLSSAVFITPIFQNDNT